MIQYQENNITVFRSALYMTTTAIVKSDEVMIMTDPTWLPDEIQNIRSYIDQHLGNNQLCIICTHSDFDHIIGVGAFPEAKIIATEEFQNNPDKEKIIKEIDMFDQSYYLQRNYTPNYPDVDIPVSANGENIQLGDLSLTFYKAPGHTEDSLFTVIEPFGIFLSGDYLSDVEFPFIYSSYKDYVNTMDRAEYILDNYEINYQIPGHGSIATERQEMIRRLNVSKYYLEHLLNDKVDLESYCRRKFSFFEGMKGTHYENQKMAKAEKG